MNVPIQCELKKPSIEGIVKYIDESYKRDQERMLENKFYELQSIVMQLIDVMRNWEQEKAPKLKKKITKLRAKRKR